MVGRVAIRNSSLMVIHRLFDQHQAKTKACFVLTVDTPENVVKHLLLFCLRQGNARVDDMDF